MPSRGASRYFKRIKFLPRARCYGRTTGCGAYSTVCKAAGPYVDHVALRVSQGTSRAGALRLCISLGGRTRTKLSSDVVAAPRAVLRRVTAILCLAGVFPRRAHVDGLCRRGRLRGTLLIPLQGWGAAGPAAQSPNSLSCRRGRARELRGSRGRLRPASAPAGLARVRKPPTGATPTGAVTTALRAPTPRAPVSSSGSPAAVRPARADAAFGRQVSGGAGAFGAARGRGRGPRPKPSRRRLLVRRARIARAARVRRRSQRRPRRR
jgi:hypothetical protein